MKIKNKSKKSRKNLKNPVENRTGFVMKCLPEGGATVAYYGQNVLTENFRCFRFVFVILYASNMTVVFV